jgi:hypothetical protein
VAQGKPIGAAVREYFRGGLFAIDLPNFNALVELPSARDLSTMMRRSIREVFASVVNSRARIPEKIAALESLGSLDVDAIENLLGQGLKDGGRPDLTGLMHTEKREQ